MHKFSFAIARWCGGIYLKYIGLRCTIRIFKHISGNGLCHNYGEFRGGIRCGHTGEHMWTLKTECRHDANFVVTGDLAGCHNDSLRCHNCRQNWHRESAWFSRGQKSTWAPCIIVYAWEGNCTTKGNLETHLVPLQLSIKLASCQTQLFSVRETRKQYPIDIFAQTSSLQNCFHYTAHCCPDRHSVLMIGT